MKCVICRIPTFLEGPSLHKAAAVTVKERALEETLQAQGLQRWQEAAAEAAALG